MYINNDHRTIYKYEILTDLLYEFAGGGGLDERPRDGYGLDARIHEFDLMTISSNGKLYILDYMGNVGYQERMLRSVVIDEGSNYSLVTTELKIYDGRDFDLMIEVNGDFYGVDSDGNIYKLEQVLCDLPDLDN